MTEIATILEQRRKDALDVRAALKLQIETAKAGLLRIDEELADIEAAERCLLPGERVSLDDGGEERADARAEFESRLP